MPRGSVLTHEAVTRVLVDGETFSSAGYARSVGPVSGHSLLEMDEPEADRREVRSNRRSNPRAGGIEA